MTPAILLACAVFLALVWVALLYDYAQHSDTEGGEVYVYSVDADDDDH